MRIQYIFLFLMTFSFAGQLFADEVSPQLRALQRLAEDGNNEAQLELALTYLEGRNGADPDADLAWEWLEKAAQKRIENGIEVQNAKAVLNLGICYESYFDFFDFPQDREKAMNYYMEAYNLGYIRAAHYVGQTYLERGDLQKAVRYLEEAATQGFEDDIVLYAQIVFRNPQFNVSKDKAIKLLKLAARRSNSAAQIMLADLYAGIYGKQYADAPTMFDYLWMASAKEPNAMARIGYCYENGIHVEKDAEVAEKWYLRAAKGGSPEGYAHLANLHAQGKLGEQDFAQAFLYLNLAMQQPTPPNWVIYQYGTYLIEGVGTEKRPAEGFSYIEAAARRGDAAAMDYLSFLYMNGQAYTAEGETIEASPKQALEWLKRAAEFNHPPAMARYGQYLILDGKKEEGEQLIQKAKELGYEVAD
ncbi:MAG: hypothetical protein MK193_06225 [Lentisphaeria bacterium]|nr:hypothetical protein [Lentisphaeria bacterium]